MRTKKDKGGESDQAVIQAHAHPQLAPVQGCWAVGKWVWLDQELQKSNPTEWARPLPPHDWSALSVVGRGKEEMWAGGGGEEREASRSAQA